MKLAVLALGVVSFVIALATTWLMIRLAPKLGLIDKPGGRKIHDNPKPLGGGVAIFVALGLPMLVGVCYVSFDLREVTRRMTAPILPQKTVTTLDLEQIGRGSFVTRERTVTHHELFDAYWSGVQQQRPLALTFLATLLILHVVGLIDDREALGPFLKLAVQLLAALVLVLSFGEVRAVTALGLIPSIIITTLWITGITNAFNFLDNMDGLSAGVAAVCSTAFLITAIIIQQWFVAATLALLLGALLGFLVFNFPPAKIFMGDSGSLVIGFVLGVLTVRTTYLMPGEDFGQGWYAVFAPAIVLALPLYDLIVVSIIRISRGKSPFHGDTNHFSHRLVARGMSRRTAVLCLYLVTAATSIAAIILPHVRSTFGAILIFAQTILILFLVALLEQHPLPVKKIEREPQMNTDKI